MCTCCWIRDGWAARSSVRICMWCAARITRTVPGPSPGASGWCRWISLWCKPSTPTSSSACGCGGRRQRLRCSSTCSVAGSARRCARTPSRNRLTNTASRRAGLDTRSAASTAACLRQQRRRRRSQHRRGRRPHGTCLDRLLAGLCASGLLPSTRCPVPATPARYTGDRCRCGPCRSRQWSGGDRVPACARRCRSRRPRRGAGASTGQGAVAEAGWDPATRILFLLAEHRLLGRKVCRVDQCAATAHNDYPDICHRCFTRLHDHGQIATSDELPAAAPTISGGR